MASFSIGVSALNTNQKLIDLAAHNIANANTPGYHRQVARLAARYFGGEIGAGVETTDIRRVADRFLEEALLLNRSDSESLTAQLEKLRQLETQFAPEEGATHALLDRFFNEVEKTSARPDDLAQRRILLDTAESLAGSLRDLANGLQRMRQRLDRELEQAVERINALTTSIAELNGEIHRTELTGRSANDFRDQRDQFLSELAGILDVRVIEDTSGMVNVVTSGASLVIGGDRFDVAYRVDESNKGDLVVANDPAISLGVSAGKTGGLLAVRNGDLATLQQRLDDLATALIRRIDSIHATGLSASGPMGIVVGHRGADSATAPLVEAGLAIVPDTGSLYISVTDDATEARTLHKIDFDPTVDSLQDIAAKLSSVPNVQAIVDSQTNRVAVVAAQGYRFDFAGRLPTVLDLSGFSGSASPRVDGLYTGADNDRYTFTVLGNGTVGVTSGLKVEVRDSAGALVQSLDIGEGYEPGSALDIGDGIVLRLSSGTVQDGDSFAIDVVADSDSGRLLAALGLATFFEGTQAATIRVREALRNDPSLLATSRTGEAGDNSNLQRIAAVRDESIVGEPAQTPRGHALDTVAIVASRVQAVRQEQAAKAQIGEELTAQQQAVSGVDTNEELVRVLQYQRAFQISAQMISVLNQTLEELANILR